MLLAKSSSLALRIMSDMVGFFEVVVIDVLLELSFLRTRGLPPLAPSRGSPRRVRGQSTFLMLISMPTEHKCLDRVHQRLNPQDHGMHKSNRVHRVKNEASDSADLA